MEAAPENLEQGLAAVELAAVAAQIFAESWPELKDLECQNIARSMVVDALQSAARPKVHDVVIESAPVAREAVEKFLKNATRFPATLQIVAERVEPEVSKSAVQIIVDASREKALIAAASVVADNIDSAISEAAILKIQGRILLYLQDKSPELCADGARANAKLIREAIADEAETLVSSGVALALRGSALRDLQKLAETEASKHVDLESVEMARQRAREIAEDAATNFIRDEVVNIVRAEAQRTAARLTKERAEEAAKSVPTRKKRQACFDVSLNCAREAAQMAVEELANIDQVKIDPEKIFQAAAIAATDAARMVAINFPEPDQKENAGLQAAIVGAAAVVVIFVAWYFFFGGSMELPKILEPVAKAILPEDTFKSLYPPQSELHDLLEEDLEKANPSLQSGSQSEPSSGTELMESPPAK